MPVKEKFFYLTLVRHGETESNKSYILQGHMDTLLSDNGKKQAHLLSSRLSSLSVSFDLVFSSDLTRAVETAQIIVDNLQSNNETSSGNNNSLNPIGPSRSDAKCCLGDLHQDILDSGHCSGTESETGASSTVSYHEDTKCKVSLSTVSPSLRVQIDGRLRERSYGVLEGSTIKQLHEAAKEAGLGERNYTLLVPGGVESLEDVRERISDFFSSDLLSQVSCCVSSAHKRSTPLRQSDDTKSTGKVLCDCRTDTQSVDDGQRKIDRANVKAVSVLLVTHGGVIREFMRYFRDEFNCLLGGLQEPIQVTPNTGVNIFKVYFQHNEPNECATITAVDLLVYNDLNHLNDPTVAQIVTRSSSYFDEMSPLVEAFNKTLPHPLSPSKQSRYEAL